MDAVGVPSRPRLRSDAWQLLSRSALLWAAVACASHGTVAPTTPPSRELLRLPGDPVFQLAASPSGRRLYASTFSVVLSANAERPTVWDTIPGAPPGVIRLAVTGDSSLLAITLGCAELWSWDQGSWSKPKTPLSDSTWKEAAHVDCFRFADVATAGADRAVVVGSRMGAMVHEGGTWQTVSPPLEDARGSSPSPLTLWTATISDGVAWAGTDTALFRRDGRAWTRAATNAGTPAGCGFQAIATTDGKMFAGASGCLLELGPAGERRIHLVPRPTLGGYYRAVTTSEGVAFWTYSGAITLWEHGSIRYVNVPDIFRVGGVMRVPGALLMSGTRGTDGIILEVLLQPQ